MSPEVGAILAGFAGPLVAVALNWWVVTRVYRRDPSRLLAVMMRAFFVKLALFCVYVVVMIKVLSLPSRPFGLSFVASFVASYAVEAARLARLARRSGGHTAGSR